GDGAPMPCRPRPRPRASLFPYTTLFRSDQDAAAFAVVEAQQQVDQGRLAGAGAADQADLLARAHVQVQALDHAALLAVVEGDVVDRKSTRLNSSHVKISYAVFCLKKKKP